MMGSFKVLFISTPSENLGILVAIESGKEGLSQRGAEERGWVKRALMKGQCKARRQRSKPGGVGESA